MNYEKAFKKLVEQIKLESEFAKEELEKDERNLEDVKDLYIPKNMKYEHKRLQEQIKTNEGKIRYDRGMIFAYGSIKELAVKLENDEFFTDEEEA